MSDQYSHDIDVTAPNEPDYMSHFNNKRIQDYEDWIDGLQPSIDQLDEMGEEYEYYAKNTGRS